MQHKDYLKQLIFNNMGLASARSRALYEDRCCWHYWFCNSCHH